MRLLVVGHGRMGRLVEALAPDYGFEVAGVLDRASNDGRRGRDAPSAAGAWTWPSTSRPPEATLATAPRLAAARGVASWWARPAGTRARPSCARRSAAPGWGRSWPPTSRSGPTCSTRSREAAARLLAGRRGLRRLHPRGAPRGQEGRALGHGAHAAARPRARRATGGRSTCRRPGPARSRGRTRSALDGPAETLELVHTVRDRATFAHGALAAARWVVGRKGWFTMRDVLGLGG